MSYLVLARKYRPQTFEEMVGQEHVTRTLANAFAKGRVHHAFLFCGARGVGKTTAARVLAKALCCEKGPTSTPCCVCEPCRTIGAGTAVDYYEIDGASNNGVDDIRELRDGVRYQPAQLRRKIYVIDEVHMLSVAAFNALLKTLEEPPPHVTFIFATTEVHKIPVTILSRCQRYDFKLVGTARLQQHLERILGAEDIAVDKGALALLAREAGGSVRDSLSLTDQVIAFTAGEAITETKVAEVLGVADRALLVTLLGAILGRDPGAALVALDAAVARGVDIAHLARTFLGFLRDAAVVQSVADPSGILAATADEIDALRALVQDVPRPQLMALFDRFAKSCEELKESPAPRLIIEVALIDMAGAEPLAPIAELVDRLERLEGRIRTGAPAPSAPPAPRPRPPAQVATPRPTNPAPTPTPKPAPAPATPPTQAQKPVPVAVPVPAPNQTPKKLSWTDIVAALPMTLSSMFAHARVISWNDRSLELGFPSDFTAQFGRDNIAALKKTIADLGGGTVDVKVATGTAGAAPAVPASPSMHEVEQNEKQALRAKLEEDARAHHTTKAALEIFGASIKEIKVDG